MSDALLVLVPLALLVAAGGWLVVSGIRARRRPRLSRTAATLRVAAGSVMIVAVVGGVGGAFLPMPYAVVVLPVLGVVIAVVVGLPLLVAAAVVDARWHRSQDAGSPG
ncbi:hypothetical protein [Serinibacter arcticus]|uniref:Integral membrane protein n=1 Tax=Serinibacter arcticus TaxID=1655435 RepID=A0A4Z1E025_9MICO|nr:hypothetical protein [Serinibacter arcticus]TGO03962.1 hypothetical protein SERN_2974 [Serinibacter arcticus]